MALSCSSQPSQSDFQELIGKAILYRQTERIVTQEKFGGYRANIVTYTVAYVSHLLDGELDFLSIWEDQGLGAEMEEEIRTICRLVHGVIVDVPNGGNVTEWSKKPACWEAVKQISHEISPSVSTRLADQPSEGDDDGAVILQAIAAGGGSLSVDSLGRRTALSSKALKAALKELCEFGFVSKDGTGSSALYSILQGDEPSEESDSGVDS